MEKILIIDDSPLQVAQLKDILSDEYDIDIEQSAEDGFELARAGNYSLILLDVVLPGMDGFTLLKILQEESNTKTVPVIMITTLSDIEHEQRGLTLGAVDYISKPFRPRELVSRMRSVLRRTGKSGGAVKVGDLKVDMEKGVVLRAGEELFLSALEYRLFLVFLNHRGKILSRGQLLEEIWDVAGEYVNDNTLTVYIKRLRDKIERDPQNPEIIKTVRGMGYRMEV